MLDVGQTSSSQPNFPLFPPSTSVSRCFFAGHLAAIPTVTWPLVVCATIPLAKAVTPTLFIAPVHVFIFAVYDGVVVDVAEIAVAAVKTCILHLVTLARPLVETNGLGHSFSVGRSIAYHILDSTHVGSSSLGLRKSKGGAGEEQQASEEDLDVKHFQDV